MDLQLGLMGPQPPRETAQAAYDGARYYRTDSGIYLKDFGRGGSDDSAKLYSGQMLDFDGVDDDVITNQFAVNGLQFTRTMTVKTSNSFRVGWSVNGGTAERFYIGNALVGLGDIYAEHGLTIKDGNYHRIVLIRDGDTGKVYLDGVLGFSFTGCGLTEWTSLKVYFGSYSHGTSRFVDGFLGNVQIWNAAFDADDVAFDYANCYQNLTADNRPGTSLAPDNLKGHWPLIEGSGDVAYDWSGNGNHGILTNFSTDDSQWSNASALDSPLAIQTALCEWALKDSNNACVPLDTADSTNFTRDYSGLNWNGRSFIDKLTGADATTSGTYTLEAVLNIDDVTALQYILDGQHNTGTGYVKQTAGTIAVSSGTVYVDGVATTAITAGLCHVVVSGITLTADELWLINKYTNDNRLTGQLAMLKLYAETWDAAKVTKAYAKAKAKYNL